MLEFWKLDFKNGDFTLVESPNLNISSLVRAYHIELLSHIKPLPYYYLVSSDEILFNNFTTYYCKIGEILNINVEELTETSRHNFFIASQQKLNNWLSGLEMLMGYDFKEISDSDGISVTSGNFEIDLLAELLLLPNINCIEWLYRSKSPMFISKLLKQISDRSRGEEYINELKRQKDLEFLNNPETLEKLKKEGLPI